MTLLLHARQLDSGSAAEPSKSGMTRRRLQIALGGLWLVDAVLQGQPFMFTKGFANTIIKGAAMGQPAVVAKPLLLLASVIASAPELNAIILVVQLLIAVGIFYKRTVKVALFASFAWGAGIWFFGEGLGGILSGNAMMLSGLPGAAIVYSLLSISLWPISGVPTSHQRSDGLARRTWQRIDTIFEALSSKVAKWSWVSLWLLAALFQILPPQLATGSVSATIKQSASSSPMWLSHLDHFIAPGVAGIGLSFGIILGIIQLLLGVAVVLPSKRNLALVAGTALAALYWTFGQSLGAVTTGEATDLNSAPLVILLGLAVYLHSRKEVSGHPHNDMPHESPSRSTSYQSYERQSRRRDPVGALRTSAASIGSVTPIRNVFSTVSLAVTALRTGGVSPRHGLLAQRKPS